MKKFVVALMLVLAGTSAAFAQSSLGIKAGYKTSLGLDQNWDAVESLGQSFKKDVSQGFNVGFMTRFGYRVYAQIEALYSYQNTAYSDGISAPESIVEHAIEVPVLFGAKLVETRNFNLRLMVGPVFQFNLGDTPTNLSSWEVSRNTVSYGLDCGLGIDVWVFAIDFRYKLIQQSYDYSFNNVQLNTQPVNAFEISLGWKFYDHTKR